MGGLQIMEINLKEILATELLRLESEFYTCKTFKLNKFFSGEEIIDFVQYGTSEGLNDENFGFPVLRLNEFDNWFISHPSKSCALMDKSIFNSLKLLKDDVLICRTNGNPHYVGKSAIVPNDYEYAYASYLFKIRPKKNLINSSTLVTYLNSKYGRMEIEKYSMASNQVNFSPAKFKQLRIPDLSHDLQNHIENIVYLSYQKLEQSRQLYQEAEQLLLEEIGLKNFKPSNENISIRKLSDSFGASGRLDSEYYQPKYEELEYVIKNYHHGYSKLSVFTENYSTGYPYESHRYTESAGVPLIRINNINNGNLDISNAVRIPYDDLNLSPKDIATENDILISMSGTIGNSCKIPAGVKAAINQRIMRITSKNYNHEVLPLIINSTIGKLQLDRIGTGGVQTNISAKDILNIFIPILPNHAQQRIKDHIKNSFNLKQQSQQLLDLAKHAIELAIEYNEDIASNYIEENFNA